MELEENKAPKTESDAPKAESSAPKVESSAPKAESSAPKTEINAPKAESSEPKPESSLPKINIGDVVRVQTKLKEGDHVRKQRFEGIVIARKSSGIASTFTVRAVIEGYGVERIFPLYSPSIEKIAVLRHEKIRRAKLYYLRRGK